MEKRREGGRREGGRLSSVGDENRVLFTGAVEKEGERKESGVRGKLLTQVVVPGAV